MASAWRQTKLVIPVNLYWLAEASSRTPKRLEKTGRVARVSVGKVDGCAGQTSGKQPE